jgi:hypothetical protein
MSDEKDQQIESLKKQLTAAWRERDDWRWDYQLTEGILKSDRKWHGQNERFSNGTFIEAAKLAKEAMGRKRPKNSPVAPLVVPDYYRDLMEWLKAGPYRVVRHVGNEWKIRDEAMSREINSLSLDELLKSEAWERFRKTL